MDALRWARLSARASPPVRIPIGRRCGRSFLRRRRGWRAHDDAGLQAVNAAPAQDSLLPDNARRELAEQYLGRLERPGTS